MFEIISYTTERKAEWDAFVQTSKNGTFLLMRDYMDYHCDRFADHSLMCYRDQRLYALLPANVEGSTVFSHQGLTYGGLVLGEEATAAHVVTLFGEVNQRLKAEGIRRVVYKCIPWIYHRVPSEEDQYAIFRTCSFRLSVRHVASVIDQQHRIQWKRDRRYGTKKAQRNGLVVEKSNDFDAFWPVLRQNLHDTYGAAPVHSLEEIKLLHGRFPQNILLYTARKDTDVVGGCVVYVTPQVVHAQYISASPEGKHAGAIDDIVDRMVNHDFCHVRYFDFGKSSEGHGDVLNESLIYQKEGFGGRSVCYDWYEYEL